MENVYRAVMTALLENLITQLVNALTLKKGLTLL